MSRRKTVYSVLIILLFAASITIVLLFLRRAPAAISSGRLGKGNLIFEGMKKVEESKEEKVYLEKSWSYEKDSLYNELFCTKEQMVLASPRGVVALNKNSGKELWKTESKPEVYEKHFENYYDTQYGSLYNDRVFYNYEDSIAVMRVEDGKELKRIKAPGNSKYQFFGVQNNVLYAYCVNTCIYAIDLNNEGIRWRLSLSSGKMVDMKIDKQILYYCSEEHISAVYASSGKEKWKVDIKVQDYYPTRMISDEERIYIFYNSTKGLGGMVRVFSKDKGKDLWKTAYEDWIYNQAAANGKLYLLGNKNDVNLGKLIIMDAESGKTEATKELENDAYYQIALTKNYVYVVNNLGHILLLDSSTGEIKKQIIFQGENKTSAILIENDSIIITGINISASIDEKEIKSNLKIIRLK